MLGWSKYVLYLKHFRNHITTITTQKNGKSGRLDIMICVNAGDEIKLIIDEELGTIYTAEEINSIIPEEYASISAIKRDARVINLKISTTNLYED